MEQSRIAERNIVKDEIRQAEVFLKRSNDTIDRLKSQEKSDFNKKQIEKLKLTVKDIETKLAVLNKKYDDIFTGNFDKEISERVENNINVIKQKQNLSDKKVKEKNDRKIEDKIILDNEYKSGKKEGLNKYQVARETDKFFNILNTVPEYIEDNLKYMPNNQGHIWRGIWYFGMKSNEGRDINMTEKCKNVTKTHEYDDYSYTLYEKIGKGQKKVIYREDRIPVI